MYRLWSKCVPMNLKGIPMTFKIKLTHNFGPHSITFSLRRLFSAKMAIFCVFGCIEYREPKQFQSKWPRWFFLVHWNTFLPQSKQNSKFSYFAFLQVPMESMWNLQTSCTGGFQWIDFKIFIIYDIVQSFLIFQKWGNK